MNRTLNNLRKHTSLLFLSLSFIIINEHYLFSQNSKLNVFRTSINVNTGTSLYTSGIRLNVGGHFNNSGNLLVTGDWLNYATPRELVCVGEAGTVLISVDGGTTWKYDTAQNFQGDLSKVAYPVQAPVAPGADVIYAAGQNGTILKSTDYGRTWVPLSQQTTSDLRAISMVDAQAGVAVGDAGEIMKTADGGSTWQSVLSPVASDLKDVTFIDASTGFIVCGGGAILRTVDGGATWVVQATAPHGLNAIRFSRDALAGYAVGQSGTILQSFDRGVTWDQLAAPAQYELKAVEAFNAKEAVAVGENGTLLKTFDGGLIWTLQQVSAGTLNDITAINNYQAIIVGDNGEMYKMCNIMNTCTQLSSATNRRLESVGTRNILAVDGTVKFSGKTKQNIGGNTITIFKDLAVNNHSTGINVQVPIAVKNSFLLSRGIIYTTEKTPLSILDNAVVAGGHDAAFVEGPVIKFGDDAFTFPLGAGNYYHPLAITSPASETDVMMAQYFHAKQYLGDSLEPSLESISDCEYWSARWLNGGGSVDAWLGWNQNSCGIDSDLTNLAAAMWNGTYWKSLGNGGTMGNFQSGMLKTMMPPWPPPPIGPVIYITIGQRPLIPILNIPTYTIFKKKLDGGYYLVKNNKLHFTYEGEYNNGTLGYKIYDYQRNAISTTCGLQRQYGDNRYTLDFSQCATLTAGYYLLEVKSEKNETFLLKFKY